MKIGKWKRTHLILLCEMIRMSHRWGFDLRDTFVFRNSNMRRRSK